MGNSKIVKRGTFVCEKCGHENKWMHHKAQSIHSSRFELVRIGNDEIQVNLRPSTLGDRVVYEGNARCRKCDEINKITLEV